jgi:hypothetical protein
MCQEKDPAMPAPGQASSQQRLGSENRSQQYVILQNQSLHPLPSIPLGRKLGILRDLIGSLSMSGIGWARFAFGSEQAATSTGAEKSLNTFKLRKAKPRHFGDSARKARH